MSEPGADFVKWVRKRSSHWRWWIAIVWLMTGCSLNFSPRNVAQTINGVPEVTIVSPLSDSTYAEGVSMIIQALITNAGADIDRVELAVDSNIIATLTDANPDDAFAFSVTQSWTAAGAGTHNVSVTAFRADGTSSTPASVQFTIISSVPGISEVEPVTTEEVGGANPAQRPTNTSVPATSPPANTALPQPAAQPQSTAPIATFNQPINVRRGPGTLFNPPIGSFNAGQTTEILARHPGGEWYKVRYGGGEGWVFANLITVSGDVSTLPLDQGPPVPTAAPPTAIPPTAIPAATSPPATTANLVAGVVVLNPSQPVCNQTFTIGFDVANLGGEPTASSGTVSVRDVRAADGTTQQETIGGFPVLQPGQTFRVDMPFTVSTWFDEDHRLTLVIDPNGQIPETVDGDNRVELTYRLNKGSC
jgi:uncharacterized protein YraI